MSTVGPTNFKCNTCGLAFNDPEFQREHMKTDWHRYNLKRRVADLPPIPADLFAQKMQQSAQKALEVPISRRQVTKKDLKRQAKEQKRQEQLRSGVADLNLNRSDSISSVNFSAGEPSQNFISSASELSTDESDFGVESGDDDVDNLLKEKLKGYVQIPTNVCFMDGYKSADATENLKYLEHKYGLVVPEEDRVIDVDGLVNYLNEKVGLGNCCLSCNYMGRSLAAVRAHMLSKQHVKIPWDTEEEIEELLEFYDLGDEDEEWEDVDGEDGDLEGDGDDELESIDGFDPSQPFVHGYDLVLGDSGQTAGHRSLNRYFKQRSTTLAEKPSRKAVRLVDYRSPGLSVKAADKLVKQTWKDEIRAQQTFNRGRKMQNHQRHFRDPLLQ